MKILIHALAVSVPIISSCDAYCQNNSQQTKPNILFIFADDQTFETLGTLNSEIHTPNLDRLAQSGTIFTHTFIQGSYTPAVCVASRASLITGTYLWKAAQFSNKGRVADKNSPTNMPQYFVPGKTPDGYWPLEMKAGGYETFFAGKWHIEEDAKNLFDHVGTVRGGMPKQTDECYDRKFIKNEPDEWTPWDKSFGGHWDGGKHWSEVLCDETLNFLKSSKKSNKPFFMYIAFSAPHDPRQSPKEFVDKYPLENILVPENFLPIYPYAEEIGSGKTLRDERLAPFPRTNYSVKVNRQEYYAIITHMDYQIGRILDELEKNGQDKNTYIIFTADNGLAVGDHGFMGKQNMYDASVRVPLIVVGPNVKKGRKVDEFVYLQDIMPTTLELAQVPKPDYVDFHSLLPLATGHSDRSAYDAVYGAYMGTQRMIRTKKYKMLIYPVASIVRLFDVENDPSEIYDLAENSSYKETMNKLFMEFKELQSEIKDPLDVSSYYQNFFKNR